MRTTMGGLPRSRCQVLTTAILALTVMAGCVHVRRFCTTELRVDVAPRSETLTVGLILKPNVHLSTCGGTKTVKDSISFSSDDPAVVRVDGGTLRAVGVGTASVE